MLPDDSLVRMGRLPRDLRLGIWPLNLVLGRRARLRAAMLVLELALDLLGSGAPDMLPNDVERRFITKDTELSLIREFRLDDNVIIDKDKHGLLITVRASPSLYVKSFISCGAGCEYYFDRRVALARDRVSTYSWLVNDSLSILSRVFSVERPRVVLTHNPVVYGKVMFMGEREVVALSIWDVLRVVDVLAGGGPTVDGVRQVVDTLVHEFLHYLLDKRYLIHSAFIEMTRRIPSVVDTGVTHELVTWSLTPIISEYVSHCIVYGAARRVSDCERALIGYPVRRRHVAVANRVINELLSALDGDCG